MANGTSRLKAWEHIETPAKVDLIVNELDEFAERESALVELIDTRLSKIEKRSQYILITFVGLLIAVLGNLIHILVTR